MKFDKIIALIVGVMAMLIPQLKKVGSVLGIKESKEMLIGVNEVSLLLCEKFKDGVQFTDFTDFYKALTEDEIFKSKVSTAYEGYKLIPAEFGDLDAGEGLELANVQLEYTPKFVEIFKAANVEA